jgi:hypothetical protein
MAAFIVLLVGAVVLGWFASEFQDRRWLRLMLGLWSLVLIGGVGYLTAAIGERFNSNAWYGGASADLIDTTVDALEKGRKDEVLAELKRLREHFQPTYENRANYNRLVEEYVKQVRQGENGARPNDPNE